MWVQEQIESYRRRKTALEWLDAHCWIGAGPQNSLRPVVTLEQTRQLLARCGIRRAVVAHTLARDYDPTTGNRLLLEAIANQDSLWGAAVPAWVPMKWNAGPAPAITAFQEARAFSPSEPIPLLPGKGWLLVAQDEAWYYRLVPSGLADTRVPGASREELLQIRGVDEAMADSLIEAAQAAVEQNAAAEPEPEGAGAESPHADPDHTNDEAGDRPAADPAASSAGPTDDGPATEA